GKWSVAAAGVGGTPYWSHSSNELFYYAIDGRIWVSPYAVNAESFVADTPRLWSQKAAVEVNQLALMPDGKRFVALMSGSTEPQPRVTFLLNFADELRRRVPGGGK